MTVLARRFTMICLIALIFGSGLSIIVAETARPARSWDATSALPCVFERPGHCH